MKSLSQENKKEKKNHAWSLKVSIKYTVVHSFIKKKIVIVGKGLWYKRNKPRVVIGK